MIEYLTPDEAADRLGWKGKYRGQKLLRIVLRRERVEKREIAIRGPGARNGTRYRLTEPMLQLHLPELFAPQIDALAVELCRRIDQVKATIGAEVDQRMAPQVQQLRSAHERLTSEVTRLATSTNDGFQRFERRIGKIERQLEK